MKQESRTGRAPCSRARCCKHCRFHPTDPCCRGGVDHSGSRRDRLAHCATGPDECQPGDSVGSDQVKIEGVTRVEDLINNLPQAFADFGGNLSNGATGAATVNLRNLGSQRTLVLVNSRRLMPGDPTQNGAASPDLNQIPAALIERVEVLTGGASAVYGADAVAGVVNFIMNDKFEGVRVDAQYSLYQHNNDDDTIADLVRDSGFAPARQQRDGRLHQGHHVHRRHQHAGWPRQRDGLHRLPRRSMRSRRTSATSAPARSAPPTRRSDVGVRLRRLGRRRRPAASRPTTRPIRSTSSDRRIQIGADSRLRDFSDDDLFNFAPYELLPAPGRAQDRRPVRALRLQRQGQRLHRVHVHGRPHHGADRAERCVPRRRARPAAVLRPLRVNCDNPLLTPDELDCVLRRQCRLPATCFLDIGRRNVEGGGRIDDLRHTSFRGVIGLRGDIADGWSYDVYGLYGTSILSENFQNDFSRSRCARR